jgi:hypothetical protein
LYDRLLESNAPSVKESIHSWFPDSVQRRIESIRRRHADGFRTNKPVDGDICGTEAMDLAMLDLNRHLLFRKAKIKFCSLIFMIQLLETVRRRNTLVSQKEEEEVDEVQSEVDESPGE